MKAGQAHDAILPQSFSKAGNAGILREPLINSSFRARRSGDPESGCYDSIAYWIPAFAGITEN